MQVKFSIIPSNRSFTLKFFFEEFPKCRTLLIPLIKNFKRFFYWRILATLWMVSSTAVRSSKTVADGKNMPRKSSSDIMNFYSKFMIKLMLFLNWFGYMYGDYFTYIEDDYSLSMTSAELEYFSNYLVFFLFLVYLYLILF